jgi:NAD(P)-dependent dehydrogenase (short-subunit alcohol dehydrogenase family)
MATAGTVAYNAAKSGVLGLMRTLAVEWAADGIRVNAILPGFFRTEMTRVLEADPTGRQLVARAPMGRWGDPRELGALAVLLASAEAGFVTGATITVDGGWSVA